MCVCVCVTVCVCVCVDQERANLYTITISSIISCLLFLLLLFLQRTWISERTSEPASLQSTEFPIIHPSRTHMSSSSIMPRLKFKRISIILVTVCFGYWIILYWTSIGFGRTGGGKRRFRHRSDGLVQSQQLSVDSSLLVPAEPAVYSSEYLTQLGTIVTPDDQRKYDEGNLFCILVWHSFQSCFR